MKILKYIGITVLSLVAIFIAVGLAVPSFSYEASVVVNAPPQKCWSVLHDTSRMKRWMNGFQRLTLTSGEWMKPGSSYEIVLQQDKLYAMPEKLIDLKEPEWATFQLTNDVLTSDYTFRLTGQGLKTEIRAAYKVTGTNILWRSILFLSKSYLQKEAQKQMDLLLLEIETGEVEFD
ncbi:MAG: SRPBCC family protein [Cyclobacteriaceae bacterium]|nr:SRPBCC family protein [Cyclobacteriaceae bacterium]